MVDNFKHLDVKYWQMGQYKNKWQKELKMYANFTNYLWMHFEMGNAKEGKGLFI
jgi:hypothetical protein